MKRLSVKTATDLILGHVMSMSPEFYSEALDRISELTGMENDENLEKEVLNCLKTLDSSWY